VRDAVVSNTSALNVRAYAARKGNIDAALNLACLVRTDLIDARIQTG